MQALSSPLDNQETVMLQLPTIKDSITFTNTVAEPASNPKTPAASLAFVLTSVLTSDINQIPSIFEDSDSNLIICQYLMEIMIVNRVHLNDLLILEQIRFTTKNIFKKEKLLQLKQIPQY